MARTYRLHSFIAALVITACGAPSAEQTPAPSSAAVGNVVGDLRLHEFSSSVFGNTRMLRVWLPPGYDTPANRTRRYPVLFLNDGQNLFDSTTAILNPMEWRVDETVSALVASGTIEPLIVVGVDNAGRRGRFREYFPYVDKYLDPPESNPRGSSYPAFLVDEVIPFIEARYRISRDPNERALGGSSAGALAALYTLISRPNTFGRVLIESPSLYVDDYHILRAAASLEQWPERIYLGVGTNESGEPECKPSTEDTELVRDVKRFEAQLLEAGVEPLQIRLLVSPCAVHNERAWAERLPLALTFLFAPDRTR
jgi:predicted alpha/beta superfamily hydrolase